MFSVMLSILIFFGLSYFSIGFQDKFAEDVEKFGQYLHIFVEETLGTKHLQDHFNLLSNDLYIKEKSVKGTLILEELSRKFAEKSKKLKTKLNSIKNIIDEDYKDEFGSQHEPVLCCGYNKNIAWSPTFQSQVNFNDVCEVTGLTTNLCSEGYSEPIPPRKLNRNRILKVFKKIFDDPDLSNRHIYFGSNEGYFIQYPAQNSEERAPSLCQCLRYDPRYRPWYIDGLRQASGRNILIAMDFGSPMKEVKESNTGIIDRIVDLMLSLIEQNDRVLIRVYGNSFLFPEYCGQSFIEASSFIKKNIKEFIGKSEFSDKPISYSNVFEDAYKLFNSINKGDHTVNFINTGLHSEHSIDEITETISQNGAKYGWNITLNLFTIRAERHITEELRSALTKIVDVSCPGCKENKKGKLRIYYTAASIDTLRGAVSELMEKPFYEENEFYYTKPYFNINGAGVFIDACIRILSSSKDLKGIACISFMRTQLIDASVINDNNVDAYMFMINSKGETYYHPLLTYPTNNSYESYIPDIKVFENDKGFTDIYNSMIAGESSSKIILKEKQDGIVDEYEYSWKKIENTALSIAVVVSTKKYIKKDFQGLTSNYSEIYHRLDLYDTDNELCTVLDQVATKKSAVIKLAKELFINSPKYYLYEDIDRVKEMMDYFSFKTDTPPANLFQNEIESKSIRQRIVATNSMYEFWTRNTTGARNALWRYIGLTDGTFRVYPGTRLNAYFDPRVRPWYILAASSPDELVLTAPYPDSATNEVLFSMAKAIKYYESTTEIAGVLSTDFTVSFFQKKMLQLIKECDSRRYRHKCIAIDRQGMVLSHPTFDNLTNYEESHLIKLEPVLAEKLIQSGYMRKKYCLGYDIVDENRFVPSPYVRYDYVITSASKNEIVNLTCSKAYIVPVSKMNLIFIVLVDASPKCNDYDKNKEEMDSRRNCYCEKGIKSICRKSSAKYMKTCECPCIEYKKCLKDMPKGKLCSIVQRVENFIYTNEWDALEESSQLPKCNDPKCKQLTNDFSCNRIGCELCSTYCNGSVIVNKKEKRCEYEGQCCKQTNKISLKEISDGISTGETTAAVVVPIVIIAIIAKIVYIFYRRSALKFNINQSIQSTLQRKKNQSVKENIPTVRPNVQEDVPC